MLELMLALGLIAILIFVHEFIHYLTFRLFGYKSKLVFNVEGIWIFKAIGIKPIGLRNNIVCARIVLIVLLMPLLFGWMWFFPFMIMPNFSIIDFSFGILLWYVASMKDIQDAIEIRKWWLKPLTLE